MNATESSWRRRVAWVGVIVVVVVGLGSVINHYTYPKGPTTVKDGVFIVQVPVEYGKIVAMSKPPQGVPGVMIAFESGDIIIVLSGFHQHVKVEWVDE